jgi:hypothetical protein
MLFTIITPFNMKKMKASVIAKIGSVIIIILLAGILLNLTSCKVQETVMVQAPANADEFDEYVKSFMLTLTEKEKQMIKEYESSFPDSVIQCRKYE